MTRAVLAIGGLLLADGARAGAWTKELGEMYVKGGANLYQAFRFVPPGGAEPTDVNYLGQQYVLYGEAGVLPFHKGQLSVSAPLVIGRIRADVEDPFGVTPIRATTTRLGDLRVAAQVALHEKLPLSAALEAKVPMYGNGSVGADYPIYSTLFPRPGDGQIDLTGWLYAGASPLPETFAEVGIGFVHRTEWFVGWDRAERLAAAAQDPTTPEGTDVAFSDGGVFTAKAGRSFGHVLPILGFSGQLSLGDQPWTRQYVSVEATALIDVAEGLAIEPRLATEVWSKAASQGLSAGLGVSYRR